MVSFSHLDAGTPEAAWLLDGGLDGLPPLDLAGVRHLVLFAAHPDDESLGAGGLLAAAAAAGSAVDVVVATNGEASHPASPTRTPAELAAVRRAEVAAAVAAAAPGAAVHLLELPDGRLAGHAAAAEAALRALVRGKNGLLLAAPWRADGHTDHDAAGEIAARVATDTGARLLEYPVWLWHWGAPGAQEVPWDRCRRLDLPPAALAAKRAALASHVSQTEPLSDQPGDEALLSSAMQEHFERPFEVFIEGVFPGQASIEEVSIEEAVTETARAGLEETLPRPGTVPDAAGVFDRLHAGSDDPWRYTTSWYEQRKRALTLAILPHERFASGLEVGCSVGVLTRELAARTDRLTAVDVSAEALTHAARRLGGTPNVVLERLQTPGEWPAGTFDLIVASEVGYYYSAEQLDAFVRRCLGALARNGVLVACHWRHPVHGWPLDGDDVHRRLSTEAGLELLARHEEEDFLLEVFVRPPAISVARAEGLL